MTTKSQSTKDFLDDLQAFTKASLDWCYTESENAVDSINTIVNFILADTQRIATLSQHALSLLLKFTEELKTPQDESSPNFKERFGVLSKMMSKIQGESAESAQILEPILQSMQFQDRVRQKLENVQKMITVWREFYEKYPSGQLAESDLLSFGECLIKSTTMIEERDIIRHEISGLPEEEKPAEDVLFF